MADHISVKDPTSRSNYTQIETTNVSFDWTVDFERKSISGSATHQLLAKEDVSEVILDTRVLDIELVEVNGNVVETRLDPEHIVMGSALHIPIPPASVGEMVLVKITYKTTQTSPALMWLDKEQTVGKDFPYMYSQCQPIHARSLAPLQDTPSVKLTYDAKVKCILPVLLSAQRVSPPADGRLHGGKIIGQEAVTYEYRQSEPIPSYLLAIAAGNLRYRPFEVPKGKTWTTGVWTEEGLLEDAYNEFCDDTPKYLAKAEEIAGPYRFGVYDLLVLPHSFPYGGMENPCISFITPTLITKDRSLTDVVIHELTHSWFGNGVTHAHASHFWLNEGWTCYIERLLQELIHGSSGPRGLSSVIGHKALMDALEEFKTTPRYRRLVIDFTIGEDPDKAYSAVPYEKGSNLILLLERTLGGIDVMRPYIKDYVRTYMSQSITTTQWKDHLYSFFADREDKIEALNTIDWHEWFYEQGDTLPVELEYDLRLVTVAYNLADRWNTSRDTDPAQLDFKPSDLDNLDSKQRTVFLERLQGYDALPTGHLVVLDELYQFSRSTNSEIRTPFYLVVLKDPTSAEHIIQAVLDWVTGQGTGIIQGRMKFCRPLLRACDKVDHVKTLSAWDSARIFFHPIARKLIDEDLGR